MAIVRGGYFVGRGGTGTSNWGINSGDPGTRLEATDVIARGETERGTGYSVGLDNYNTATTVVQGGSFSAFGGEDAKGIHNDGDTMLEAEGVTALALALSLGVGGVALANGGVERPRWVLGGGASDSAATGGDVTMRATLGQPVVGGVTNGGGSVTLGQGFWYSGDLGYRTYLPLVIRNDPSRSDASLPVSAL